MEGKLPDISWPQFNSGEEIATRKVWGAVLEALANEMPSLVGGSADLEPSNVTSGFANVVRDYSADDRSGRNFAYGVREFPMGVINNGIALHGGLKPFGATFFVFSDYERPALRLRALQGLPIISEYTHDSIFVGEDGPTHQPIEHLMATRTIPNLLVIRPADANETVEACRIAFEQQHRPSLVILSRQGLPVLDQKKFPIKSGIRKGGYILSDCQNKKPDVILFATGSEIWVALEIKNLLIKYNIRVVNIPCWELLDEQSVDYIKRIIGSEECVRVSIEAGITFGWSKFTGMNGINIGIDVFGESAPGEELADHFQITPKKIADKILKVLKK